MSLESVNARINKSNVLTFAFTICQFLTSVIVVRVLSTQA